MAATAQSPGSAPGNIWLQGPVSDIVLGGGLLYVPILCLLLVGGDAVRAALPFFATPLLLILFSSPHLGATLLRVYERPEDRRAYSLFSIHLTFVIAAFCVASLFLPVVGSLFITFYLTIVPWHFTGQNYGVALVLLQRQGIDVPPDLKKWLHAAFVLPFALFLLALHGTQRASAEYAPLDVSGTEFQFMSLGLPGWFQGPAVMLATLAYLFVLGECVRQLWSRADTAQLLPASGVFFSQALWFAAPVIAAIFLEPERLGPFSQNFAAFTFTWISVMHGIQYLWITNYFVKKERPGETSTRFLSKATLMGSAIYGVPLVLLAPLLAGRVSFAGVELMLAGALNIQHIMLDSVIWKLRNKRIAKILLRGADEREASAPRAGVPWVKALVLTSGLVGVACMLLAPTEREFGILRARERGDVARMQESAKRMRWMGREDAALHADIGFRLGQQGDVAGALREFERAKELDPSAMIWTNIGALREREGRNAEALSAYGEALALDPDDVSALHYAGRVLLKTGQTAKARELLERALALAPERDDLKAMLGEAERG